MDILDGLNAPQKNAVTAPAGPVLVLAGPGSGKTRVLTHRIAHLIQQAKVPPWHIMAVTFTNKAAREMRERVERLLGGQPRGLAMGTFHSSCTRILRREADALEGYTDAFVIFDSDDQKQVVKQALADLNLDDKRFPPAKMLNNISHAKNELVSASAYAAGSYIAEVTRRVYVRYQELLEANNAMDFDDLLFNVVRLFDDRPDILARYQERYQHILVDEFQDTNTAQYALLNRLADTHQHIFAVGDSDQSIYKWRGADFRNIHRFREAYPDAQTILLEQNYRSTQLILDAAKAIIRRNKDRVDKDLFTERRGGQPIEIEEAYNETEEGTLVVDTIKRLGDYGYKPGDCAVMYRTNAQSRALEEAFLRANMRYKLVGATRFYNRREVKDLIAFLRLVHNPADAVSLQRVINTPTRGIGKKTVATLLSWSQAQGWQPGHGLIQLATNPDVQHPFTSRAFNALNDFGQMFHAWLQLRDQVTVGDLLDTIVDQTKFRQYLEDGTDEGADRWANVMEFRGVASSEDDLSLSEFLEQVALVSDVDNLEEDNDVPTLLTLHAAKGLEFRVVFITGLEDGILPHSRTLDDAEELAEERRLFYVGLTRAKDRLYLTHAFRRTVFGSADVNAPSRFLLDLPENLVKGSGAGYRREQAVERATSWHWSAPEPPRPQRRNQAERPAARSSSRAAKSTRTSPWSTPAGTRRGRAGDSQRPAARPTAKPAPTPTYSQAPTNPSYQTGQKVRHAKFGDGIVIESKSTGNDEEVTVAFGSVGIKRLAASFAKLEQIESESE